MDGLSTIGELEHPLFERESRLGESGDEDGNDGFDGEFQRQVRDSIRNRCRSELLACAASPNSAMTTADAEEYLQYMEERYLDRPDLRSEAEKTRALQELAGRHANEFMRQARSAGDLITKAEQEKWITSGRALWWREQMKRKSWGEKKEFIKHTLPQWVNDWKGLKEDVDKAEKLEKDLGITAQEKKDIPELDKLHSKEFDRREIKVPERRHIVNAALAYLKAHAKDKDRTAESKDPEMKKLYTDAKSQLQAAVKANALPEWKVGSWLRRIFESNASPENIRKFVNGEGPTPLSKLIKNWIEVRGEFDKLEKRREQEGTPRSFHFVHVDVFLDWNYERRKSYLKEANNRFTDFREERYDFLQIRHELDAEDWEGADRLIAKAKATPMTDKEREKLQSMENFLQQHRSGNKAASGEQAKSPDAIRAELDQLLDLIPHSKIRERFRIAMRYGYQTLWALCTMNYNWEWCRLHGFSNDEVDERFRQASKNETHQHLGNKEKRWANVDLSTDTSNQSAASIGTKSNTPKVANVDDTTDNEPFIEEIHKNNNNRDMWYQTRIVEKKIPYADVLYIIHHIQPKLKKGMRQLESMGARYEAPSGWQKRHTPSAN